MRHDTEDIPSTAESPVKVWSSSLVYLGYGSVGEYHFVVNTIDKCPAVSPADEAYSSFRQYQFSKLSFKGREETYRLR